MKFTHTNIISTDCKALADFYIKSFEYKIVPPIRKQSGKRLDQGTGLENAKLEGAHLLLPEYREDGPTLEIYPYKNIEKQDFVAPNKRGFGHIAFKVGSVETVLQKVMTNGGNSFGQVTKRNNEGLGEITFVYAKDSEGNLIELQSWKKSDS